MENIAQKLHALIIAEISGIINPEEQELLNMLRNLSPQVKEYSDRITESLASVDLKEIDDAKPPAAFVLSLAKQKERKKVFIITAKKIAASVIGILILVFAIYKVRDYAHNNEASIRPYAFLINGLDTIKLTGKEGRVSSDNTLSCNGKQINLTSFADKNSKYSLDVPAGRVFSIVEKDGSKAKLNSESRIDFSITSSGISIDLFFGEAYFEIAKNANRFVKIPTPNGKIQVLGTTFNVNTYTPGVSKVSLVEGSIRLEVKEQTRIMKSGTQAICTEKHIQIDSLDSQELEWTSGIIVINNARATDVEVAARRYFGVKLIIDSLARGKTAQVKIDLDRPVEKFIEDYVNATGLKCTVNNSTYYIK
jgi:transmembrane sensor